MSAAQEESGGVDFLHVTSAAEKQVALRIVPAARDERCPTTFICVIDLSSSMGTPVVAKDADGKESSDDLCTLDLAKHALLTLAAVLNEHDKLALIPFSSTARVALGVTSMDDAGRERAAAEINKFMPQGSTNIWDGLRQAIDLVRNEQQAEGAVRNNVSIILFTDGQPTNSPPRGEAAALRASLQHHGLHDVRVDCLGFGSGIVSDLLTSMASAGNSGAFGYIPDAGFVGTVMINNASNTLSSQASQCVLTINDPRKVMGAEAGEACIKELTALYGADAVQMVERPVVAAAAAAAKEAASSAPAASAPAAAAAGADEVASVPGGPPLAEAASNAAVAAPAAPADTADAAVGAEGAGALESVLRIHLGSLRFGLEQSVVLSGFEDVPTEEQIVALNPRLAYTLLAKGVRVSDLACTAAPRHHASLQTPPYFVAQQALRCDVVRTLLRCETSHKPPLSLLEASELVHALVGRVRAHTQSYPDDALASGMLLELEEQVQQAVDDGAKFQAWGRHYIPSLARAHRAQTCVNFKDPGVGCYVSPAFDRLREQMDLLFISLPMCKPVLVLEKEQLLAAGHIDAGYDHRAMAAAGRAQPPPYVPVDMGRYNNRHGGCFSADSLLLAADGKTMVPMHQIQPGQMLYSAAAGKDAVPTAVQVLHMLRIGARHDPLTLVRVNTGLALTPWHPMRCPSAACAGHLPSPTQPGEWMFPAELADHAKLRDESTADSKLNADYVYNLVLDKGHEVLAGAAGTPIDKLVHCITLAHGMQEAKVAHAFFGTQRVLQAYRSVCSTETEVKQIEVDTPNSIVPRLSVITVDQPIQHVLDAQGNMDWITAV